MVSSTNLGKVIPITQVAKGIYRIGPLDTHSPTPWTSPHLVVGKKKAAILEPGETGQVAELLEAIKEIGVDLDRIAYIITSHIHLHHCAGVPLLLEKIPTAKFVCHQRAVPHVIEPTKLNASTLQVWGPRSGCPQLSPVPADRILGMVGGEVLDLGGRELEIIDARGHAPHMIAIFDRLTKVLFPGDAAGVIEIGSERGHPDILPPLFELDIHIDTLHRLQALKPKMLLVFGFGGVSHSPRKTLKWAEDDVRAVERIVREGMEQELSNAEIGRRVSEYYNKVGDKVTARQRQVGRPEWGGIQDRAGKDAPFGMVAYVMKHHPDLKRPK